MFEPFVLVIIGVIFIFGFMLTGVYYLARYHFRTHDKDTEVLESAKIDLEKNFFQPPSTHEPVTRSPAAPEPAAPESEAPETVVSESTPPVAPRPVAPVPPLEKPKDLREALLSTRNTLWGRIKGTLSNREVPADDELEAIEEVLYTSDLGPQTVQRLAVSVGESLESSESSDIEKVRQSLRAEMLRIFNSLGGGKAHEEEAQKELDENLKQKPQVWMVVGVNGAGKTTTIGKLAHQVVQDDKKVMVVAGDTFRAAADEQLKIWSHRAQVEIFSPKGVTDPSAVAFDACSSAQAKGIDVVIVDTAGRLHTQAHLMDELRKMKRVIQKVIPEAPHETWIVLDANSGQNALVQARSFHEAMSLTGAILTKLDGSAKGGVAVGLACELKLPIRMIGVGEGLGDLRPFDSQEFVDSIL